jgi:hypothetical protein
LHIVFGMVALLLVQLKPVYIWHELEHPSPSKVLPSSQLVVKFSIIIPSPHVSVQGLLGLLLLYPVKHTQVVPLGMRFMPASQEVQLEEDKEQVIQGATQAIED